MDANSIRVYPDGNQWCAVLADFENVQESPAGFHATPDGAIEALREDLRRSCRCPDDSGSCEACVAHHAITPVLPRGDRSAQDWAVLLRQKADLAEHHRCQAYARLMPWELKNIAARLDPQPLTEDGKAEQS